MEKSKTSQQVDNEILSKLMLIEEVETNFNLLPGCDEISTIELSFHKFKTEANCYIKYPDCYNELREGLTYLQVGRKFYLCRKGLRKPFEFRYQHLLELVEPESNPNPNEQYKKMNNLLFEDVISEIEKGKIEILCMKKENGSYAHISYLQEFDCWAISSRFDTILARNRKGLDNYYNLKGQKLQIALSIAELWFEIIDKRADPNVIQDLKNELKDFTLVGELLGHPKNSSNITTRPLRLEFFTLVNKKMEYDLSVSNSLRVIEKLGLPIPKFEKFEDIFTKKELFKKIESIYQSTYMTSIFDSNEGVIVFIQNESKLLANFTITSLEYNLYSYLKTETENIEAKNRDKQIKSAYDKVEQLHGFSKYKIDEDKYKEICKDYIDCVISYQHAKKISQSVRFIKMIELVIENGSKIPEEKFSALKEELTSFEKEINESKLKISKDFTPYPQIAIPKFIVIITPPLFFDFNFKKDLLKNLSISEISDTWFEETKSLQPLSLHILNIFPKIKNPEKIENTYFVVVGFDRDRNNLKSSLKKLNGIDPDSNYPLTSVEKLFVASKDKESTLEKLWKSSEEFILKLKELFPERHSAIYNFKANKFNEIILEALDQLKRKKNSNLKRVFGLIPIGLPGMGKTTLITNLMKSLDKDLFEISVVSQDLERAKIIFELKKKNPKASEEELFQEGTKKMRTRFTELVVEAIQKTEIIHQKNHLIILDKGHALKSIETSICYFKLPEFVEKYDMKAIVFKPECKNNFEFKENFYPFSLTFILSCLDRAFTRKHETLTGDDGKKALIVLKFLNLFKNFRFRDEKLLGMGVHSILSLPFTNEDTNFESKVPQHLIQSLGDLIDSHLEDKDEVFVNKFLNSFKMSKLKFPNLSIDASKNVLVENLVNMLT